MRAASLSSDSSSDPHETLLSLCLVVMVLPICVIASCQPDQQEDPEIRGSTQMLLMVLRYLTTMSPVSLRPKSLNEQILDFFFFLSFKGKLFD